LFLLAKDHAKYPDKSEANAVKGNRRRVPEKLQQYIELVLVEGLGFLLLGSKDSPCRKNRVLLDAAVN
jgi:hypothetical protein